MILRQYLRKFHQTVVIKTRLFKVQFEKRCSCQHMDSLYSILIRDSVKPPGSKIAFTDSRWEQLCLTHRNFTFPGTTWIIILHFSRIFSIYMGRKFYDPLFISDRSHDLRPCSSARSSKPVQFVKFVCIFCVQYFLTLPRQFIQVRIILLLWKFSFRIVRQRTHSWFSNDCQSV